MCHHNLVWLFVILLVDSVCGMDSIITKFKAPDNEMIFVCSVIGICLVLLIVICVQSFFRKLCLVSGATTSAVVAHNTLSDVVIPPPPLNLDSGAWDTALYVIIVIGIVLSAVGLIAMFVQSRVRRKPLKNRFNRTSSNHLRRRSTVMVPISLVHSTAYSHERRISPIHFGLLTTRLSSPDLTRHRLSSPDLTKHRLSIPGPTPIGISTLGLSALGQTVFDFGMPTEPAPTTESSTCASSSDESISGDTQDTSDEEIV
eukprot:256747_1